MEITRVEFQQFLWTGSRQQKGTRHAALELDVWRGRRSPPSL